MKTLEQIDYLRKQLGVRDSQVLNDLLNSYDNAQVSLQNQLVKLQQKIDKAIEYIENNGILDLNGYDLLDILRGKDNEPKKSDYT